MSAAELLAKIQVLPRAERLRLVREIIVSVEEELLEMPAPWERDPRVMSRLLESIAQSKAGQRVEAALIDPFPKKPSDDLLALADIANSDVEVNARDRAEDAARLETLEELTRLSQELGLY